MASRLSMIGSDFCNSFFFYRCLYIQDTIPVTCLMTSRLLEILMLHNCLQKKSHKFVSMDFGCLVFSLCFQIAEATVSCLHSRFKIHLPFYQLHTTWGQKIALIIASMIARFLKDHLSECLICSPSCPLFKTAPTRVGCQCYA